MRAKNRIVRNARYLCVLTLLSYCTSAFPGTSEDYQLAEQCGKRAQEWFAREFGKSGAMHKTDDGQEMDSYENHYNRKLNKCLVEIQIFLADFKAKPSRTSTGWSVRDVNEQKVFGSMQKGSSGFFDCQIGDLRCSTEAEWKAARDRWMSE